MQRISRAAHEARESGPSNNPIVLGKKKRQIPDGNSMMESKREANRKVVRMALGPTIGSENERAAEAALEWLKGKVPFL